MQKIKIAINGFGRIGRMFFRISHAKENFDIVAINDVMEPYTMAHLLKYDSVHRRFNGQVESNHDHLIVNGKKILIFREENPENLPWKKLGIDVVIEATGKFVSHDAALKHVEAGAQESYHFSACERRKRWRSVHRSWCE